MQVLNCTVCASDLAILSSLCANSAMQQQENTVWHNIAG